MPCASSRSSSTDNASSAVAAATSASAAAGSLRIRGASSSAQYDGHGVCDLEFGDDEVGMVDVTFFGGQRSGELIGPSYELAAEKARFGSTRAMRWFGREWSAVPA
jgi:sulfide:quinone oxidoreductase